MTEKQLLENIIDLAHHKGWLVAHFRPGRTNNGWRTPVMADAKGFPDLVMSRVPRLIIAELKAEGKRLTLEQIAWMKQFNESNIENYVWRPSDWDDIVETLK